MQKLDGRPFWPCFACPKLENAVRTRIASKIRGRCNKKPGSHNFDFRKKNPPERIFFHLYQTNSLRGDFALKSKLWLPGFLFHRPLILLAISVLTAFSNFGQAKHGQKGVPSNFCSKKVCSPMYSHHFTFYDPSPIACPNKNVTQVPVTYHWSVF